MDRGKRFIAYVIKAGGKGQKILPPNEQLKLIRRRLAAHPNGRLISTFYGEPGPESALLKAAEPALEACRRANATLIVCEAAVDLKRLKGHAEERSGIGNPGRSLNGRTRRRGRLVRVVGVREPVGRKPRKRTPKIPESREFFFGTYEGISNKITDFEEVWNLVEHDCSDFLAAVTATRRLLFRGVYSRVADAFVAEPRANRIPRDTGKAAHAYVAQWMKEKGFAAHRENSLFTSSDYDFVLDFARKHTDQREILGSVYAIFPTDGSSYSWSRSFKDFGGTLTQRQPLDADVLPPDIDHLLWLADFNEGSLKQAMLSGHEVLVAGASYYAILWRKLQPDDDQYDRVRLAGGYQDEIRFKLERHNPKTGALINKIIARPLVDVWRGRYTAENRLTKIITGL